MRALLVVALLVHAAAAEPLPSGSIGVMFGGVGGTGSYARKLGLGYSQFGGQAAWQPMTTDRWIGWSLKWTFNFNTMYDSESARIDTYLRTLQMDFLTGVRIRPWSNPRRYLALRGGVELFRSNEVIMPGNGRAFVGAVGDFAFEQYAFSAFLLNVDVRYGLIGDGPAQIALFVGASISVP